MGASPTIYCVAIKNRGGRNDGGNWRELFLWGVLYGVFGFLGLNFRSKEHQFAIKIRLTSGNDAIGRMAKSQL